jgi:hypothetical protein
MPGHRQGAFVFGKIAPFHAGLNWIPFQPFAKIYHTRGDREHETTPTPVRNYYASPENAGPVDTSLEKGIR